MRKWEATKRDSKVSSLYFSIFFFLRHDILLTLALAKNNSW